MSLADRPPDHQPPSAVEAALVRHAQAGDEAAFGELISAHQKMIHTLTFRMTGSATDAADVA